MNFVHIIGRLGKDPEARYTTDGKKITVLIVATNSRKGGNEETIWWRVTLWGDRWDKMMQHFTKGKPIIVGGEMKKPEIYIDKNGTAQLSSLDLTADYIKFVPFGKEQQGNGMDDGDGQHISQQFQPSMKSQPSPEAEDLGIGHQEGFGQQGLEEESLPF
ncbi:MAG: single-stranded DNA-binding protein [Waddliaceae bacterium]